MKASPTPTLNAADRKMNSEKARETRSAAERAEALILAELVGGGVFVALFVHWVG